MTCDEFVKACVNGGYIYPNETKQLKKWLEQNPKESYTEEYFIDVYRHFESIRYMSNISDKWRYDLFGLSGNKSTKRYKHVSNL